MFLRRQIRRRCPHCIYGDDKTEPREKEAKTGDSFRLTAATKTGRAFKAGAGEILCLVGGLGGR